MELEKDIDRFIEALRKDGMAKNTAASYESDLRGLWAFCEENRISGELTDTVLRSWLLRMEFDGKSAATIARAIASVRAYVRYQMAQGKLKSDPAKDLKSPGIRGKDIVLLSATQIEILLEEPDGTTRKGRRDRAMLELAYSSGARVSELLALSCGDVNTEYSYVTIRKEGSAAERVVPYGHAAAQALADYLMDRTPEETRPEALLFTNKAGGKMTRQGFYQLLKEYGERAGIDITGPQALRDAYAGHMLRNGAGCADVARLLGVSEGMVLKYLDHSGKARITEVYKNTHPRA